MGYLSLFACLGDLGAQPSAVVVIVSAYDTETSREVEPPSRKRLVRLKYTPATIHRCDQPCSLNPAPRGILSMITSSTMDPGAIMHRPSSSDMNAYENFRAFPVPRNLPHVNPQPTDPRPQTTIRVINHVLDPLSHKSRKKKQLTCSAIER